MSARPDQINRPVMYRYLLPLFAEGQSAEVKTKSMFAEHTHTDCYFSNALQLHLFITGTEFAYR